MRLSSERFNSHVLNTCKELTGPWEQHVRCVDTGVLYSRISCHLAIWRGCAALVWSCLTRHRKKHGHHVRSHLRRNGHRGVYCRHMHHHLHHARITGPALFPHGADQRVGPIDAVSKLSKTPGETLFKIVSATLPLPLVGSRILRRIRSLALATHWTCCRGCKRGTRTWSCCHDRTRSGLVTAHCSTWSTRAVVCTCRRRNIRGESRRRHRHAAQS